MPKQKSVKKKIAEGRGKGEGPNYTGFLKANEAHSRGCASQIYDPIENRMVDTMSAAETDFYFTIRLDPSIKSIREQIPLDMDIIRQIQTDLNVRRSNDNTQWSTDFLVTYKDGAKTAFSVKPTFEIFDMKSTMYLGREKKYASLMIRQHTEYTYWKKQNAEFVIVTREFINRTKAANAKLLLSFWNAEDCANDQQKMLFLIVRGILPFPDYMDTEYIRPKKLLDEISAQGTDVNGLFAAITRKGDMNA